MNSTHLTTFLTIALLDFAAVFLLVRRGGPWVMALLAREEGRIDRALNQELLLNVNPRLALLVISLTVLFCAMVLMLVGGSVVWGAAGLVVGAVLPWIVVRLLERRRRARLEVQLVDGIMSLASGVRAGLNLVQAMELLVSNHTGPIRQEFAQLLREYQMGLDLNQAMRNAANRIESTHYRLLFTAIEMHRRRGGNTGESLDRIAESIREIQRLEGKLEALTAQGRTQATMMALMPFVVLGVYYLIDPTGVTMLFVQPVGRAILLGAVVLIMIGFLWIRRIMAVDI